MHNGRNKCSQPLETHFFGLVLLLAQSRLRRGGELGRGMELGAWTWGAEGKVESISPGEVKEPGLLRPSPTPPTTQAKTMGACAQPPGCRGQGQAPAGSSPAVPATTLPGTMRARQPSSFRAAPAPTASCPRENQLVPTQQQSPPQPRGGGRGALTTELLRWLWTVKSGQKSKSATARSRDSARGRAFSSSSSPCSGHRGHLRGSRPRRGSPRTWGREDMVWAPAGTVGSDEVAGEGSGPPITPNLPRQKAAQWGASLGAVRKPPTDWEGTGHVP